MKLIKDIFGHYLSSNTFEKGAALSYYAAFSFLPMIVIIISILGIIFKEDAISGELNKQLKNYVGDQAALQFEAIIKNQRLNHDNIFTTILGFATLALAATGVFNQIQKSLNSIWGLKAKPKSNILNYFVKHIISFSILIIFGFILLLSATMNSFFYKYSAHLPDAFANANLYEHLFSFLLITFMFAILYRFHRNAIVPWKTALVSAGFTSILFLIGKVVIGIYIAHSDFNTTFGAASMIALLMIWVYYTSQILYLGASFAYVFGKKIGSEIKPADNAVRFIQKELAEK